MTLKATNKIETNRYELEILVDADTFAAALAKAYAKNVKKIAIPGFRKGKAPRHIIERMYGESFFYEDAIEIIYPDAVEAAIKEAGLELVSNNIGFDLVSIDKATGVDFKITITVKPTDITVKKYKGLEVERVKAVVTDEEIDEQVKMVAERNSRLISVTDRAAADGDTVVIDYEGFVGDKAFDGGKAEGYSLKLGSNSFIPGFEPQIVGHNIDEEFDINVTFPEEYHAEELKGKEAVFKIKLHEIKQTETPVIDDEFAKDVSEFDTLDEYKADLKAKALDMKKKNADDAVDGALIDALLEGFKAEIPNEMIEARIDDSVQDFAYRLQMQGLDINTYVKYMGGDMAAFRDTFREQADKQVKLRLALEKIAADEKITPTDADIDEEYESLAKAYNTELDNVKKAIPATELTKDISVRKAFDLIRDNAVITDVDALTEKKPAAKKTTTKKSTTAKKTEDTEEKPAAKKTTSTTKKSTSTATKSTTAKKTTTTAKKTADAAEKPAAKKTTSTTKKSTSTAAKSTTAKKTTTKKADTAEEK